jgi:hypothetical protein
MTGRCSSCRFYAVVATCAPHWHIPNTMGCTHPKLRDLNDGSLAVPADFGCVLHEEGDIRDVDRNRALE